MSTTLLATPWRTGVLFGALALAANLGHAAACGDKFNPLSPVLASGFGYDISNTRSNVSSINSSNVASLRVAMTHVAVGKTERRSSPVVTEQAIVFTSGLEVVAANRKTGCTYWTYAVLDKKSNAARSSTVNYISEPGRTPLILVGDAYANVYAINASSGALVWQKFVGTDTVRHMITGGFQYDQGTLYVPVASREVVSTITDVFAACCKSHGLLQAIDPYTGNIKWTYHTAPDPKLNWLTGVSSPSGMSLWGVPAIDRQRKQVLIGTGQNFSQPATNNSDSIIALDMATGKPNWMFQAVKNDAWNGACQAPVGLDGKCPKTPGNDFDFGAPPILTKTRNGADIIVAGSKGGVVYAINPSSGAKIWERRVGAGANLGGIHWGMAVSANKVYVGVSDVIVNKFQRLDIATIFNSVGAAATYTELVANATPGVYALEVDTGKVVWENHPTHVYQGATYPSIFSAAVSVTNDLVFAASLNGVIHAFRANDGVEVWNFDTVISVTDVNGNAGKGGSTDSVGPYVAGGDLLINSGYSNFGDTNKFQAGHGNALFVLRLPGQ